MADTEPPLPAFKKRGTKASAMRKRPAPPPSDKDDSSSGSDDTTDDETGTRIKRRKREGVQTSTKTNNTQKNASRDFSKSTKYNADRNAAISANDNATKASTWYTDAALKDSTTNPSNKPPTNKSSGPDDAPANQDGTYKGSAAYSSHIQKNPDKSNKHSVGPVKAPTNVRAITVTDFAPDVCKDYKQTGFCGFGDSCKFLHAREDYKQGWQLDKEWEKAGSSKKAKDGGEGPKKDADLDDEEKMLATIPFKCVICKGDYKMPVVTKCGHYFCERCAMQRYMKGKKEKGCAQCGADTYGSFGVARKLKDLLEKKARREKERKDKEDEEAAAAEEG
jgi:RING finger protein 113A